MGFNMQDEYDESFPTIEKWEWKTHTYIHTYITTTILIIHNLPRSNPAPWRVSHQWQIGTFLQLLAPARPCTTLSLPAGIVFVSYRCINEDQKSPFEDNVREEGMYPPNNLLISLLFRGSLCREVSSIKHHDRLHPVMLQHANELHTIRNIAKRGIL